MYIYNIIYIYIIIYIILIIIDNYQKEKKTCLSLIMNRLFGRRATFRCKELY